MASANIPRPEWLDPKQYPPPRGNKILLLTQGRIATVGHWSDDCVGWLPLPNTPQSVKQEVYKRYGGV